MPDLFFFSKKVSSEVVVFVVVLLDVIDLEASARIAVFFFLVLKSCEILSLPLAACGISRRDLLIGSSTRSIGGSSLWKTV